jgi:hypothetical protein
LCVDGKRLESFGRRFRDGPDLGFCGGSNSAIGTAHTSHDAVLRLPGAGIFVNNLVSNVENVASREQGSTQGLNGCANRVNLGHGETKTPNGKKADSGGRWRLRNLQYAVQVTRRPI